MKVSSVSGPQDCHVQGMRAGAECHCSALAIARWDAWLDAPHTGLLKAVDWYISAVGIRGAAQ